MASKTQLEVLVAQEFFGKKLYDKFSETPGNVLFSPSLVHALLSVLVPYLNERTKIVILKLLRLTERSSATEVSESIWSHINSLTDIKIVNDCKFLLPVGYELEPSVQNICRKFNLKVERNNDEKVIIVSSLHLKPVWKKQFETQDFIEKSPFKGCFKLGENQETQVDMIFSRSIYKLKSDDHLEAEIVEIPCINKNISMVVILPNDPYGIDQLQSELFDYDIEEITDHLHSSFIELFLPKFKLELTMDIIVVLQQMELGDIFNSSIVEDGLALDQIISKVCLEIDEEGGTSETDSGVGCRCQVITDVIRVDHPFMLYIIAKGILPYAIFRGKIVNPIP